MTEQGRSLVYPGEIKSYVYTMTCTQISMAVLFMITPIWINKQKKKCPSTGPYIELWYILQWCSAQQ